MPSANSTFVMRDHQKENSFGVYVPVLNAGNIAQYTDSATPGTLLNDLVTAINGVCLSVLTKVSVQALSEEFSPAVPVDPEVRNENTLILKWQDSVEPGLKGRFEVRGVDIGLIGQAGTDNVDMGGTEVAALIAALEAYGVSKIGNPISIYDALTIGRKS